MDGDRKNLRPRPAVQRGDVPDGSRASTARPAEPTAGRRPVLGNASVTIQPSSGAAGGTVVAWPSLDHGNSVRHLIAGSMDAAWSTVPIFADSHGGHQFFITSGGGSTAPPTENDFLDTADAAMIADLEAAWADFNAAITTFSAAAQNTPPPPPPATDSRGFWRIKADWSLDSDSDGILDHAEFALAAAQAAAGDGLVGNPHNADTNNDGIPDG